MNMILLFYAVLALIIETVIDALGSIVSRRLNFNYSYLSVCTVLLYGSIGYFVSKEAGLLPAIIISGLTGLYGGSVGLWMSIKLKANVTLSPEEMAEMLGVRTALLVAVFSISVALVGYGLTFVIK